MKDTIKRLQILLNSLEKKVNTRNIFFFDHTKQWRNSKKGKNYDNITAEKCMTIMCLKKSINKLKIL